jgi:cytoskeletal protein CcmA (bactofilin family)
MPTISVHAGKETSVWHSSQPMVSAQSRESLESVSWVESVDNLICKFIVATVLKKFIPQRPGSTEAPEDTRSGENPAPPQTVPTKTQTQKNSVMADTHNKNLLSNDVELKGSIKFANEFTFDGKIEGEISSGEGILTVGENGDVRGEIKAKSVIVMGKVQGNITVNERCELRSRSALIGDLKASRLIIEEGATFVGKSEVTPNKNAIRELGAKEKPQEAHAPR